MCFAVACFITKRVTDDEASRLFLYLQKLSREWSLLNNVTWDKVGSAVADATYGGYILITFGLLFAKLANEIPTARRVLEMFLLGIGALLYIVLGSLAFAALDSVPPDLVDNAAVLGTLSLITAALFLLDLCGPRAKKAKPEPLKIQIVSKPQPNAEEKDHQPTELDNGVGVHEDSTLPKKVELNGHHQFKVSSPGDFKTTQNGYKKMKERDSGRRFGIYGKDGDGDVNHEHTGKGSEATESERHSPVWSQIRKGQYGKYDIVIPSYLYTNNNSPNGHPTQPSSPSDPGYVQYTAQRWGQPTQKTPRHSPTQV
ncbi:hypothetical protein PPYR_12611 [Photinus pyralis]|uniref:Uncharacterized protein n=1 Tax=Photinus pyralis TaxID=7054 RepID=A0A1Y1M209_PHOPY|nr:uncharacterized protein LOC116177922 isoform X2 [Photinus pyralis]KAB0792991.1 hypothetical protein PPYR_12611 [Photinus pyralis]